jgi:hypothetical protein
MMNENMCNSIDSIVLKNLVFKGGLKFICKALENNQSIENVKFRSCIEKKDEDFLLDLLKTNKFIKQVNLVGNKFSERCKDFFKEEKNFRKIILK